jgi:hypothetical protein
MELSAQGQRVIEQLIAADAMPILRKQMREATDDLQPAVRNAARALPSQRNISTEKGGSLRAAVAASIKRVINLSARSMLVAITNVPHGGKSNLARVLEGEIKWEHPTFGHDPQVTQTPYPFFWEALAKYAPFVEAKMEAILTEFEREL